MSGDVTKLPKWAQQRIQVLERNVDYWQEIALTGPDDTNTFVRHTIDDDTPLERDARVRFQLGERYGEKIEAHIDGEYLELYGGESLHLEPYSSNVLRVKIGRT